MTVNQRHAVVAILLAAACRPEAAAAPPLTLGQAVAEALRASPALGAPDEGRTLAAIRERQSVATVWH